jgi:outer membrane lipoprotein-sorting protein
MKRMKNVVLAVVTLLTAAFVNAQTADEIINKHIEVIGGKDKIGAIKSLYVESSISVMGQEAPAVTQIINGKGFKNEVDFGGQKIIQVYTDKDGWAVNPMMGMTAPTASTADEVKTNQVNLYVGGLLFDYNVKGNKVELLGQEDVNGTKAYKIKATTKDNAETIYYIDPTTYYIVKEIQNVSANGQMSEVVSVYSNYKKTDYGYTIPYSQELTLPQGFTINITTSKVEVNKDIDPKIFEIPK